MPTTTDLVSPNAIIPAMKVNGKKQALQEIAAKAASLTGQNEKAILEILLQRETLGSTGVGNGVAIPHGSCRSSAMCSDCLRGWSVRSISKRSTANRSI